MSDPYDTLTGTPLASQSFTYSVLGPAVVGWVVQLMLGGFAVSMFINYLGSELFKHDTRRLKALLLWVILLLILHSVISYYSVWHYSTWQIRDANTLFSDTIADSLSTLPIGLLGVTVQVYLSVRAGALFQRQWSKILYYIAVAVTTVAGLVGALIYLGLAIKLKYGTYNYHSDHISFADAIGLFLWGCTAADALISVTLCTKLWTLLGHHSESRPILKRLIMVAVQSASYTAICAFVGAILSHSFANDSLNQGACLAFVQPLSSLYAISFLVTLSSRDKTQKIINDTRARFAGNQDGNAYSNNAKLFPLPLAGGDPFTRLPEETIKLTPMGRSVPHFTVQFEGLESESEQYR